MLNEPPEDLTPLAPLLFEKGTLVPLGRPLAEANATFRLCAEGRQQDWIDAYYSASVQLPAAWRGDTLRWGVH